MGFFSSTPQPAAKPSTHASAHATPTPAPRKHREREPATGLSIIAKDLTIAGDLQAAGIIRVEGRVIGNVHAGEQVLLSEGGIIEGDVVTREAVIGGRVHGSVRADERVEVQTSAHVKGDVVSPRLLVHEGGSMNGNVKMERGNGDATGSHAHHVVSVTAPEAR
ncbi:MAG: bactofilin family protein [Gemmatimonadales bacterium]